MNRKKQGFTLVELLVVLAVIGILAGMIFPALKRGLVKAHDEKCRTNLKQLHTACISYANDHEGKLPYAQSYEKCGRVPKYNQYSAWVSWSPADCNPDTLSSFWDSNKEKASSLYHDRGHGPYARFGVENGQIFEYMNKSAKHYVCPTAEKISIEENGVKEKIYRTYAMNEFFFSEGYKAWWRDPRKIQTIGSSESFDYEDGEIEKKGRFTPEASKLLLFSEILIPNYKPDKGIFSKGLIRTKNNACRHGDCVLVAWEKDKIDVKTTDVIMPIHQRRKKEGTDGFSHVIFLDGHIEQVQQSFKVGNKDYNTLWFLLRGIDPKNTKELGKKLQ